MGVSLFDLFSIYSRLSLVLIMSSLHWEARRRQNVADKRIALAERRHILTCDEDEAAIYAIADEMRLDAALPTHFLLNKSKAALSKQTTISIEPSTTVLLNPQSPSLSPRPSQTNSRSGIPRESRIDTAV